MAHVLKPRVAETSTTTGTGAFTLAGALTAHQAFSAVMSTSDTTEYMIVAVDGSGAPTGDWEEGVGTYSGTNTLTRTTVTNSSNAGSAVSFAAGDKTVLMTPIASRVGGIPRSTAMVKGDGSGALVDAAAGTDYQAPLVSGTNIKTINGSSVLGSGDLATSASAITISNKTGAYTVVAGDLGKIINCTSGTFTVSLTAAATLGAGFYCWVWNTSTTSTHAITIDPNGAETIDGLATLILRRGEGMQIVCDGTNWQTGDKKVMRGYAENIANDTTRPTASGNFSVAIGPQATASGGTSYAIGYLSTASGTGSIVIGAGSYATSNYSTAIGTNSGNSASKAATGDGAMALGGSYASGTDSFAAAVVNNSSSYGATGSTSIVLGYLSKATSTASMALGRQNNISGAYSAGIGWTNTVSVNLAYAFGNQNNVSQSGGTALGTKASVAIINKFAYGGDVFSAVGDAQTGTFVLRAATTNATATVLTTDAAAAGSTNQVILPNSSAYTFSGLVVARQQAAGGTASAAWKIEGLIRREANAASTTLVTSTVTAIDNTPGWTLALSADTTNGGLKIEATGAASTNIRWVATVQTSEVTYA